MTANNLVRSGAVNMAGWHRSSLDALGLSSERRGGLWFSTGSPPPIFHSAITLLPGAHGAWAFEREAARATCLASVCDSWSELELTHLGLRVRDRGAWMARPPGPARAPRVPAELVIDEVRDGLGLRSFERASIDAFGAQSLHELGPFGLHAPGILDDPCMHAFVGRVAGQVVSASMSYVGSDVVGVYGVATLPEFRRRGFGEALTWEATMSGAGPAVLQAGEEAASLYRRMGYEPIGQWTNWSSAE